MLVTSTTIATIIKAILTKETVDGSSKRYQMTHTTRTITTLGNLPTKTATTSMPRHKMIDDEETATILTCPSSRLCFLVPYRRQ